MTQQRELHLIDLDQEQGGYRQFISAWVALGEPSYIVDPGPRCTAPQLIKALRDLGVQRLDFVLATHIHLDHTGGAAEVLEAFPQARFHCHAVGREHMVSPTKLWQGSLKVLGDVAKMYGEPRPVEPRRLAQDHELEAVGIRVIDAPGHAAHHQCYLQGDCLFAGEALGTRQRLPSARPYLRPATPPRFFLDQALSTIERLESLEPEPRLVVFAHHGLVDDGVRLWCQRARTQLGLWLEIAQRLSAQSLDNLEQRFFHQLMIEDPLYGQGAHEELEDDLKARERHFLRNTLAGLMGYLKDVQG